MRICLPWHLGGGALQTPFLPQVRTVSPTRVNPELQEKFAMSSVIDTIPFTGSLKDGHETSTSRKKGTDLYDIYIYNIYIYTVGPA